jgi:hypothetical protein
MRHGKNHRLKNCKMQNAKCKLLIADSEISLDPTLRVGSQDPATLWRGGGTFDAERRRSAFPRRAWERGAFCNLQSTSFSSQLSPARAVVLFFTLLAILLHPSRPANGDIFELASGGRIEGKLLPSDEANKSMCTIDLAAGGRVTVPRSQITKIDPVLPTEAEYYKLARISPDTAEGHWRLAEWCREHKLADDRRRHLERILELDPNHVNARAALGFHQQNGQWMNRGDVMASRGMVLFEGKYVTPQQVELLQRQKEARVTQADWTKKVEQLRRRLSGPRQDQADEARVKIQAIQDPQAADAIVTALRRETNPNLKRLWIEVASQLNAPAAIDALVNMSLTDPNEEIRHECLENLVKSRRTGLATPYMHALKDKENIIVNRAGAGLGQIGDRGAMGPLIEALITKHKIKISDANPDQHAYTFSPDGGGAFSFGGSNKPQFVVQPMRNPAVLEALVTLSNGPSFDYDQAQWRSWLAAQAKASAVDVRRDP